MTAPAENSVNRVNSPTPATAYWHAEISLGFTRLGERTEFALCSTPMTIERETGARHGAITGWAHTNHPMPAVHEFGSIQKATETGIPDMLQCGMWTFSPAGLPVSIITGKLAADQAIKRLRKKRTNA